MELEKINLFKIKDGIERFDDFVKTEDHQRRPLPQLKDIVLPELPDFDGEASAKTTFRQSRGAQKTQEDFPWLSFINKGLPADGRFQFSWQNNYPSAIVAIKINNNGNDNYYALTFGLAGQSFLKSNVYICDFGIKVAMNICDEERLRRVKTSIHEAISTNAEKQISTGSSFPVFNIDDEKEFIRSIAGSAKEEYNYISSLTGKESITIKIDKDNPISWENLIERINELNDAYHRDDYKKIFPGYDKFHFETDKDQIDKLDKIVFKHIKENDTDNIHLFWPEFVDYGTHSFLFASDPDGEKFDDITLDDLLAHRKRKFTERSSIASIKNMKVYLYDATFGNITRKESAYRCLVAEIVLGGNIYILSMGQWKQISDDFKNEVSKYIEDNEIEIARPAYLPDGISIWNPKARVDGEGNPKGENRESVYNIEAARRSRDLFLFDTAKIEVAGEKKYEICDLLHTRGVLIQVKRLRSGSASISHVFLQGRFYAHAFLTDEKCRLGMRTYIEENAGDRDVQIFVDIVPEDRGQIIANQYTVLFCIITNKQNMGIDKLPFMSQFELMNTHKELSNGLGFECRVVFPKVLLGP